MRVHVSLPKGMFEERAFYAYPRVLEWLHGSLRTETSFYQDTAKPVKQAHGLLQQFIGGQPLNVGRRFKRMRPEKQDVFELATADVRFFGWFPVKNTFIAVAGDVMVNTHSHDLYPGYRDLVVRERQLIDLDEPKWTPGATENDVISF